MSRAVLAILAMMGAYVLVAGFENSGAAFRSSSPAGGSGFARMGRDAGRAVSTGAVSAISNMGD